MDTKSKNSKKWLGNLLCILVVVVLAAGTIICYQDYGWGLRSG